MKLKKIARIDAGTVELLWIEDDNSTHVGRTSLQTLRDGCPCAGCQGETVLLHTYKPAPETNPHPRKYELVSAEPVGSYAMKFVWGDGHDQGLYTWEHLRSLCQCPACSASRQRTEEGADRA